MTTEEDIKSVLNDLPPVEEVINWAKANNFLFMSGHLGDASCGCGLTALFLMKHPFDEMIAEIYTDGRSTEFYSCFDSGFPWELREETNISRYAIKLHDAVTVNKLWHPGCRHYKDN